jgi:hypothetical protein
VDPRSGARQADHDQRRLRARQRPALVTESRGGEFPTTDGLQYYFDLISWLLKKGAPLDYIGFQNHGGLGMPGPEAVLKTMTTFADAFKKPIEVTEFEITLQNGNDPAQRRYQADYFRDFFIAVFSHPAGARHHPAGLLAARRVAVRGRVGVLQQGLEHEPARPRVRAARAEPVVDPRQR